MDIVVLGIDLGKNVCGEPVKMQRVVRPDPFVEEVFARNEATKKPWVKAEPSSHIRSARLPGDLEAGTHCIAVRLIDEYGRDRPHPHRHANQCGFHRV